MSDTLPIADDEDLDALLDMYQPDPTLEAADDWFADVAAFRRKFGQPIAPLPAIADIKERTLGMALIKEEYIELSGALDDENLPEIADACVDLIWVTISLALAYGIDLRAPWRAVREANMKKEPAGDGKKVIKPQGWLAPDIAAVLARQEPMAGQ